VRKKRQTSGPEVGASRKDWHRETLIQNQIITCKKGRNGRRDKEDYAEKTQAQPGSIPLEVSRQQELSMKRSLAGHAEKLDTSCCKRGKGRETETNTKS